MNWGLALIILGGVGVVAALFWGRFAGSQSEPMDDVPDEELQAYVEALKPTEQSPKEPT